MAKAETYRGVSEEDDEPSIAENVGMEGKWLVNEWK